MIYDAIVVGGGPAGSILAYELARRGLQVLILEKAVLPRYVACGGGLTLKTVRRLPFDASSAFDIEAFGGIITYGGRRLLKIDVRRPFAWLTMRDRFDHFLVQRAVDAGARLVDGTMVGGVEERDGRVIAHARGGDAFAARLLAGADGVESIVARSVGLLPKREAGTAIEAEVFVPPTVLEAQGPYATFDFGALPDGFGWIFPKRDHLSAGVFQARPGKAVELRRRLEAFIEGQATLRDHAHLSWRGRRIPLGGKRATLHKGRVLLVGDAGNLASPFLGEGIYYAVVSAQIAAHVMAGVLSGSAVDLGAYTDRVNAEIVQQLAHARCFAGFIYRFPHLSSVAMSRSALMQNAVFGTMRGDLTFEQLNRTLVFQLPRMLLQMMKGEPR